MGRSHNRWLVSLAVALAATAASVACFAAPATVGKAAPAFSIEGSDGKTHTLKSLTKGKALVLYFIKDGCPVNRNAAPFFVTMAKAYNGKANFVGVINGNGDVYNRWKAEFKPDFTILLDSDLKLINDYGAERSPWVVLVSRKGKVLSVHKGYSEKSLGKLSQEIARAANAKPAKLDVSGAPSSDTYG